MQSPIENKAGLLANRVHRRTMLRFLTGAGAVMVLPLLQACSSAPAAPTEVPPTAVPKPTIAATIAAPAPAPTTAPTTAPTVAPTTAPAAAATTAPTTVATTAPTAAPTTAPQPTSIAAAAAVPTTVNGPSLPNQHLVILTTEYAPYMPTFQSITDEFKARQPNVSVETQSVPGDQRAAKLKVLATSGTPPDVSWMCCGDAPTYGDLGMLLDLTSYMKRDNIDPKIYYEGSYWEGLYDPATKNIGSGQLLALPFNFVFTIIYYNKDLLAKAKVDPPAENWTWDDLVKTGQQLTLDKNGKTPLQSGFDKSNIVQFGFDETSQDAWDWVLGAGGNFVTPDRKVMINTPETIKGITFYRDLIQKYYVSPSVAAGPQIPLFPTGKSMAMHRDGSWNLTLYQTGIKDFQWDVAQLPIGPIGKRTGYGGSNQFSTWKGIKNPDAGWELLKWLTSAEMTLKYWSTHGVPSVKTAAQSTDFPKFAKLTSKMAQYSALAGTYMQPETTTIRRDEWGTALTDALGPVFEGKITPEAGAKIAQDKIQAIMARPS